MRVIEDAQKNRRRCSSAKKYGDEGVRVLQMVVSTELCGGVHTLYAPATSASFKIIIKGIAAGALPCIEAITGLNALNEAISV